MKCLALLVCSCISIALGQQFVSIPGADCQGRGNPGGARPLTLCEKWGGRCYNPRCKSCIGIAIPFLCSGNQWCCFGFVSQCLRKGGQCMNPSVRCQHWGATDGCEDNKRCCLQSPCTAQGGVCKDRSVDNTCGGVEGGENFEENLNLCQGDLPYVQCCKKD